MASALDEPIPVSEHSPAHQSQQQLAARDDSSDAHFHATHDGHNGYFQQQQAHLFALPQQQHIAFEQQQQQHHQQQQQQAQAQAAYLHHLAMQHQQHQHQHQQQQQQQQRQQQHQTSLLGAARVGAAPHGPPLCRLYAAGYCRFGEQCRYSHSAPLTASASSSSSPSSLVSSMQLPTLPPPPPPGLDGSSYQHQPHIHAALIQQQMDALRVQANMQHSQQQVNMQRAQHQHQHVPPARASTHDQAGAEDKREQTEEGSADEKDKETVAGGENGHEERDKGGAAGGEDDSETVSTPRSTAPSSTATTYLSSSSSSPSALSANATPFSSSFSSPSFPPSSASSSQHHSPFLNPTYPTLQPSKLGGHTPPYNYQHFAPATSANEHSHFRQQPFSFNRHTAPFVPSHSHSHSQPFDYAAAHTHHAHQPQHHQPQHREIEARDPEREAELFGSMGTGVNFDKYDDIAVDAQGNDVQPPIAAFTDLPLPDFLQHNIDAAHYVKPTPIQKHALPNALMGRDIMACAQTGSGKTAAFLFPLISMLLSSTPPSQFVSSSISGYGRQKVYHPSGLILAPTRELATQIHDEAYKFISFSPLSSACVYGGQDIRVQFRELDRGCDILVATPGRLMDMVDRGRISLSMVRYLVLDEADRMLDMGFEPQIRAIVEGKDMMREGRQTLMFSATFPKEIQRLAQDFLYNYIFIAVGRVGSSSDFIRQSIEYVEDDDKQAALMRLLPLCTGLTLVFVERKKTADMLERYLQMHGIAAASIHGDRSQHERENALSLFRSGRCTVLVATDVAARGLDIPNVTDVLNFDMPSSIDDYVHRIGRTGRAGREGSSATFFNSKSSGVVRELVELLTENKQEVPAWLDDMYAQAGRVGGGGGRGGRGRGRWGARDFRQGQFASAGGRGRGARGGFGGWRGGMGGMSAMLPTSGRQSNSFGDMVGLGGGVGAFYSNGGGGYDNSGLFTGSFVGGYGAQRS